MSKIKQREKEKEKYFSVEFNKTKYKAFKKVGIDFTITSI